MTKHSQLKIKTIKFQIANLIPCVNKNSITLTPVCDPHEGSNKHEKATSKATHPRIFSSRNLKRGKLENSTRIFTNETLHPSLPETLYRARFPKYIHPLIPTVITSTPWNKITRLGDSFSVLASRKWMDTGCPKNPLQILN